MATTLVLGASHNRTSDYAITLLAAHERVTYIATGTTSPDATASGTTASGTTASDATAGLERGPGRRPTRPQGWHTVETTALSKALVFSRHPVVIDTLSHWVWRVLEQHSLWGETSRAIEVLEPVLDELLVAYTSLPHDVVAVSDEVGWGPVAATEEVVTHHEVLAHVNHRFSAASDRVHLIIGGRVVDLSDAPSLLGATRIASHAVS